MNGPEPMAFSICLNASVSAIAFGMMNGTFEEIFAIEFDQRARRGG